MSAPIYSLLAEKLNISEERAQKFLTAMLREVKKRAQRQGVRLPSLGTFREKEGQLTFEPSDSLARAVNQRFEGLEDENVGRNAADDRDNNQESDGPSTITLGYQAGGWSPIEASESDDSSTSDDSSEADTEEFQVLSSEEAADTEEFQTPDAPIDKGEQPSEDEASTDDSSADTEELYPLVEDVPDASEEEESSSTADTSSFEESDATYQDLGDIWNDESSPSDDEEKTTPESPPSHKESSTTKTDPTTAPSSPETSPPRESPESSEGSSLTSPILIAPFVLIFLGGGWFILGQRGILPSPSTTVAGVTGQLQEHAQKISLFQESSSSPTRDTQAKTTPASEEVSDREESKPTDEDQESPELSSEEGDSSPSDGTSEDPAFLEIDPSAGGWTIVVASRTDRAAADSLVASFRNRFENRSLPIDIVVGKAENKTRYRVAIGQYRTQSEVYQALDEHEEFLPEGAWPLQLR